MTKRIFRSILLVSVLVFLVGVTFMIGILYQHFGQQLEKELQNELTYLSIAVENDGTSVLENLPEQAERITLVAADGTVLFDNRANASEMDNHAGREEIAKALESGTGTAVRYSDTLGEKTVYLAQQLSDGTVLRVSSTQYSIVTLLLNLLQPLIWIFILALALSGAFAYRASKKIVAPLNKLDLEHPDKMSPMMNWLLCLLKLTVSKTPYGISLPKRSGSRKNLP